MYNGPSKRILWSDATTGDYVQYDEEAKELEINITEKITIKKYGKLTIGGGAEAFTLGNTLATFLGNLSTWLNSHTHLVTTAPGTTGPASTSGTGPSPTVPEVKSSKILGE
jgi:hypothetical protein